MRSLRSAVFALLFVLVQLSASAALGGGDVGDSLQFDDVEQYRVTSDGGIVAADHRYASEAAAEALAAGGNAADAGAVAILALGVANPAGSGLGGGGFCLYRDGDQEETTVLDFRETAPLAGGPGMYEVDGEVDHDLARRGGLAVATPGEPAGVWALHGRFGQLDWEDVVEPARRMADQGIPVDEQLAARIERVADDIKQRPRLAEALSNEDGELYSAGDLMVRDDLVQTLKILQQDGVRPFYSGDIAEAIVDAVADDGGMLAMEDFTGYRMKRREPITGSFWGFEIESMPPPSSGGIALVQALNILDQLPSKGRGLDSPDYVHIALEALKHAFADRAHWLGDADFVDVPVDRLTSDEYAAELADRLDPDGVLDTYDYGTTPPDHEPPGTAHVSAVDADDNMLACTITINTTFGSMVYVPDYGLVLNNEMADFNVEPGEPNVFGLMGNEQNAVEPAKRPLSSMSPTLIYDDGEPVMSIGASGGPMIISGVYFLLLDALLFDTDPLEAMIAPRFHHQWIPEQLYVEIDDHPLAEHLRRRGHQLEPHRIFSAVQLILRGDDEWIGVTDPRKGGIPAAE